MNLRLMIKYQKKLRKLHKILKNQNLPKKFNLYLNVTLALFVVTYLVITLISTLFLILVQKKIFSTTTKTFKNPHPQKQTIPIWSANSLFYHHYFRSEAKLSYSKFRRNILRNLKFVKYIFFQKYRICKIIKEVLSRFILVPSTTTKTASNPLKKLVEKSSKQTIFVLTPWKKHIHTQTGKRMNHKNTRFEHINLN